VLTSSNPYSFSAAPHVKKDKKFFAPKKVYQISQIQSTRRSMIDNRYLIISIVAIDSDGRNKIKYLNILFSSIFKLYQFLELLNIVKSNLNINLLLKRDLLTNQRMV